MNPAARRPTALPLLLALLLASGGCASRAPAVVSDAERDRRWQAYTAHRDGLGEDIAFLLEGRVSTRAQPMTGRLRWQQATDAGFDLHLSGPVGLGSLRLRGQPDQVEVISREVRWTSDQPEAELQARLGWALPLAPLRHWVRGLPAPGEPHQFRVDAEGRLSQLEQSGWTIDYERYHAQNPALPARLRLRKGDTELLLLADRWQPAPP